MELITATLLGLGLSAAVGFRIFLPFLVLGIVGRLDLFPMAAGMEWISTTPALIALATASLFEIGAYFIPWVDNFLDTITTPAAFIGGTLMMGTTIVELDPVMKWGLAIIAGGGTAGLIQSGSALTRLASTATTGGLGNPLIASGEVLGAIGLSLFSLFIPMAAGFLVLILLFWLIRRLVVR